MHSSRLLFTKKTKNIFLALYLLIVVVLFSILSFNFITEQDLTHEENIDFDIVKTYITTPHGFLKGSDQDLTQARLPMFLTASAVKIFKPKNTILFARSLSVIFGILSICIVFVFFIIENKPLSAIICSFLLAFNPYYLSLNSFAMTGSDSLFALLFLIFLLYFSKIFSKLNWQYIFTSGLFLGLAISAKFTALILLLPIAFILITEKNIIPSKKTIYVFMIIIISLFTASTIPPEHFLNNKIISKITKRIIYSPLKMVQGKSWNMEETVKPRSLNLVLKESFNVNLQGFVLRSGFLFGLGLILFYLITGYKKRRELFIISFIYYLTMLILPVTPHKAAYMLPLIPIMTIILTDNLIELFNTKQKIFYFIFLLIGINILIEDYICFPNYNLAGYATNNKLFSNSFSSKNILIFSINSEPNKIADWLNKNIKNNDPLLIFSSTADINRIKAKTNKINIQYCYNLDPKINNLSIKKYSYFIVTISGKNLFDNLYKQKFISKENISKNFKPIYIYKKNDFVDIFSVYKNLK